MVEEITEKVSRLADTLNKLELEIAVATDALKEYYARASQDMPNGKSYFLNGVQAGQVVLAYAAGY
jgi:hypothetical protein